MSKKDQLLAKIDEAILASSLDVEQAKKVIFTVPGTTYVAKIGNTRERLKAFRKKVEKSSGFDNTQTPKPKRRRPITQRVNAASLYKKYMRLSRQKSLSDAERKEHLQFARQIERELSRTDSKN
jgi:hypothetical protein